MRFPYTHEVFLLSSFAKKLDAHYHKRRIKTPILTLLCHIVSDVVILRQLLLPRISYFIVGIPIDINNLAFNLNQIGGVYDINRLQIRKANC